MAHRDELLFQTVHQSSELWLKLAWFEVETATGLLRERELAAAIRLLRRANEAMRTIIGLLDMLEQMSPWEYTRSIRPVLGHGSGFDSPGWNGVRRVSPDLGAAFHELRREAGSMRSSISLRNASRSGTSGRRSGASATSRSSSGSSAARSSERRARPSSSSAG